MATALGVDPGSLSLDELEAELATLASHLYAGTCRWLELVSELDRRGGFADSGRASLSEWLAWRCALTPRSAREHVRVARSLPGLPLIHAAFARGELSYAKVRALTRVASPHPAGPTAGDGSRRPPAHGLPGHVETSRHLADGIAPRERIPYGGRASGHVHDCHASDGDLQGR